MLTEHIDRAGVLVGRQSEHDHLTEQRAARGEQLRHHIPLVVRTDPVALSEGRRVQAERHDNLWHPTHRGPEPDVSRDRPHHPRMVMDQVLHRSGAPKQNTLNQPGTFEEV